MEATRQVAMQADKQKRLNLAQPDRVCTLFFWGFGIDEKLEERLLLHKQNRSQPYNLLNFPLDLKKVTSINPYSIKIRLISVQAIRCRASCGGY